jgi:eukaryotic-like serine/threonine-protein kinase
MPDSTPEIKKLGRYDIVRVLGEGAMGVVYEAVDPNLNRKVAIKTVRVGNLSRDDAKEYELRFRTEAHSAARLQHPNIVSVYDSDRDGNTAYLVMEFVQGQDLKHFLDSGHRYSLQETVSIICDLLAALEYAHEHKIIHRDIKPANLLIEASGRVKLADFGVARIQDSGEATRTQGGVVGTLKYMSPEQAEGRSVDARSDMFSVGIVLYQLLTDNRPFDGDSYFSIVNQIANLNPPPPSTLNPMLPLELDDVLAQALAKNKEDRFSTAHDFAFALRTAARQADPTIVPSARSSKFNSQFGSSKSNPGFGSAGSGSRPNTASGASSGTGSTLSGTSPLTQELELVYWKDVKDSTTVRDFEDFLKRFPDGVYADLSRRQIQRIQNSQASQGASVALMEDSDATQMMTKTVSDDPTRTSMFGGFASASIPMAAQAGAQAQGTAPPSAPTGTSLIALKNKIQTPMVMKPPLPPKAKSKSNHLPWILGAGAVALTLLLSVAGWYWYQKNHEADTEAESGADVIMFSDQLKIIPKK